MANQFFKEKENRGLYHEFRSTYREPHIFDENHRLRKAVLWGPPGIEAYLAQLYPEEKSLFFDYMNVPAARNETGIFSKTLNTLGTQTVFARNVLIDAINPKSVIDYFRDTDLSDSTHLNLDRNKVLNFIYQKAEKIMSEHQQRKHPADYKEQIAALIQADVDEYQDEQKALALNLILTMVSEIPMGNSMYARDQMNTFFNTIILASMKKDIRFPEVELYKKVYEALGYNQFFEINSTPNPEMYEKLKLVPGINPIKIKVPERETFEGGDFYIHNNIAYIGVGARTSFGAAMQIYEKFKDELKQKGYSFVIVFDENAATRPRNEQMNFMHIDTWSYEYGKLEMEMFINEAKKRKILLIDSQDQQVRITNPHQNYYEFLQSQGYTIAEIPKEEQQEFGCNNLYLGKIKSEELADKIDHATIEYYSYKRRDKKNKQSLPILRAQLKGCEGVEVLTPKKSWDLTSQEIIIVPIGTNKHVISTFLQAEKTVILVPLLECTRGFGAAHCMVGQLNRLDDTINLNNISSFKQMLQLKEVIPF